MTFVGIDIAKLNHFIIVISYDDEILIQSYKFTIDGVASSCWFRCAMMKECYINAIPSVIKLTDTPDVVTLYSFFSQLWQSDQNHQSLKEQFPNPKVKEGKKTGVSTPVRASPRGRL